MLEKIIDFITKIFALLMVYTGIIENRSWVLFFAVFMFGLCLVGDCLSDLINKK